MNMVSFKMMIYPFTYLLPHTLFLSLFECDFLTLGTTYDVPKEPFVDGMPYGLYLTSDKFIPSNQVCGLKQIIFDVVRSYNCKRSNTLGLYRLYKLYPRSKSCKLHCTCTGCIVRFVELWVLNFKGF